jgi:hypothetical protein
MTLTDGRVHAVDRTRSLFGQVMWYVAATAGLIALGAYLGRNVGYGVAIVCGGISRWLPGPASGRCWR